MIEGEAKVVTEDVRQLLLRAVRPDEPDYGEAVQVLSERACTSTRTIYRILSNRYSELMGLDLADRLALAAGGSLSDCGQVEPSELVESFA